MRNHQLATSLTLALAVLGAALILGSDAEPATAWLLIIAPAALVSASRGRECRCLSRRFRRA